MSERDKRIDEWTPEITGESAYFAQVRLPPKDFDQLRVLDRLMDCGLRYVGESGMRMICEKIKHQ